MGFLGPVVQFPPPQGPGLRRKITITPVSPPGDAVAYALGDGINTPTTTTKWDVVARPKRKALTDWTGIEPYRLPVPILIDGFADDRSIEPEIELLRRLERVAYVVTEGVTRPAVCLIAGPLPLTGLRWVVEQVEWGDEIRRDSDGARTRQAAVVHLLEFVDVDLVVEDSPAKRAQAQAAAEAAAAGAVVAGVVGVVGGTGFLAL